MNSSEQTKLAEAKTNEQEKLVTRILNKDTDAFDTFIALHKKDLVRTAKKYTPDDSVEDAINTALIMAWKNLDRYNSRYSFLSWLLMLVKYRAIDLSRREETHDRVRQRFLGEARVRPHVAIGQIAIDPTKTELVVLVERIIETQIALPHHREWIKLFLFAEMSQRQIAAHVERHLGTVKRALELSIKKLRAHLPVELHTAN